MSQSKKYNTSLYIYRRDLRLHDNTGLIEACAQSEKVYTLFVFDKRQVNKKENPYFSERAFAFMIQSLQELAHDIKEKGGKLMFFEGGSADVVKNIVKDLEIEAVFVNEDNTPFAQRRDMELKKVLESIGVTLHSFRDYTLSPTREIRTNEGNPYSVFTPFKKKASKNPVTKPHRFLYENLTKADGSYHLPKKYQTYLDTELSIKAGREEARSIMSNVSFLRLYKDKRNIPAEHGTSRLSPHLKFGTISIRELYHKIEGQSFNVEQFIAELYWRDFYQHIAYHFPYVFERSYLEWANNIEWINDKTQFEAWKKGKTGVPMVDAGMRELNETGWMHNRSRMIVASYLTKNLLIDWRWGEKYFARQLIDYDPANNNGGWQWSASVGADPRPLRIFNPYTQAGKYDPEAVYIKRWVPELSAVDPVWLTGGKEIDLSQYAKKYPKPLVDQKESYHRAKKVYRKAKDNAK